MSLEARDLLLERAKIDGRRDVASGPADRNRLHTMAQAAFTISPSVARGVPVDVVAE